MVAGEAPPSTHPHLNASLAAILATTAPLFTALLAAVWLNERLTLAKGLGVLLGLGGVGVLVGWSPLPVTGMVVLAVTASLLSSLLYAIAAIYANVVFKGTTTCAPLIVMFQHTTIL
jgi:drug/metabolite transporter (DMT)-like permease